MQQVRYYNDNRNKHFLSIVTVIVLLLMAISEFVPYLYGFHTLDSWTFSLLFGQWAPLAYLFCGFGILRHLFYNHKHHLPPFLHMHYINYILIVIIFSVTLTAFTFNYNDVTNQGFNNSFYYWWNQIRVSQWYDIQAADGGLISASLYGLLTNYLGVAYLLPILATFSLLASFLFTVGSWVGFWHFISSPFHKGHRLNVPSTHYTEYGNHTKKLRDIESGHHRYLKNRAGSPVVNQNRTAAPNPRVMPSASTFQAKYSDLADANSNNKELWDHKTTTPQQTNDHQPQVTNVEPKAKSHFNINDVNLSPIIGDVSKRTRQEISDYYKTPGSYPEMDREAKAQASQQYADELLTNSNFDSDGNEIESQSQSSANDYEDDFEYSFATNSAPLTDEAAETTNSSTMSDSELFSFDEENDTNDDSQYRSDQNDDDEDLDYSYQDQDDYREDVDSGNDEHDDIQASLREYQNEVEDDDYPRIVLSDAPDQVGDYQVLESEIEAPISINNLDQADDYKKYNTNHLLHPETNRLAHNKQVAWAENKLAVLDDVFQAFHINAHSESYIVGPTVTKFMVVPGAGVKLSKITNLANNFKLSLAVRRLRIEAPTPGTSLVGIEVPNLERQMVSIKEIVTNLSTDDELNPLAVGLGKDIDGNIVVLNIESAPHLLIAGATGSGKSVCINGIINSILMKATPQQVKFILIDPKKVELINYEAIPHLLTPIINDPADADYALNELVNEMENRYEVMAQHKIRNIDAYNEYAFDNELATWPKIIVIIDELADLMALSSKTVEKSIIRITQKARAAGIHLIVATQRPSTNVITGLIKANLSTRIAFAVSAQVDSRTIIDFNGAETLIGNGDMLFSTFGNELIRLQGCFIADQEINDIIKFATDQGAPNFNPKYQNHDNLID